MAACSTALRRLYTRCTGSNFLTLQPKAIRSCSTDVARSEEEVFEELFRKSSFVRMGRPQGKAVAGKVTHIVGNEETTDLYVDFGWKFHTVLTLPQQDASAYAVNDLVKINLKSLEATGHFLGQSKRITMCEADAALEGKLETTKELQEETRKKDLESFL